MCCVADCNPKGTKPKDMLVCYECLSREDTMIKRTDIAAITFVRYYEPMWGTRRLGPGRYALDMGRNTIIVDLWWLR